MNAESVVSEDEAREAEKRQRPRSVVIFETIRREGENELERPSASLFWSAFAAGLSMVFSLVTQGVLRAGLPDAPWRTLVAAFGYTLGFLIVILGRQQLFTENTLTPLLPVFNDPKLWRVRALVRLWAVIFVANLLGAAIASAAVAFGGAFSADQLTAFNELAKESVAPSFAVIFTKAIFAGWILALMVWLLPLADQLGPLIIIVLTYVIAAARLSHSITGSVDVLYGVWSGVVTLGDYVHFIVPTFCGNVVGGVAFVAAISSAEIAAERGRAREKKPVTG
jgi:formate/nitrite transporter FocA (FNT family)